MHPYQGEKSRVDDFAVHLLHLLGYAEPYRYFVTQKGIPLYMCSDDTYTKTDVCVVDRTSKAILLLLQEDQRRLEGNDPEPKHIAEAIAIKKVAEAKARKNLKAAQRLEKGSGES